MIKFSINRGKGTKEDLKDYHLGFLEADLRTRTWAAYLNFVIKTILKLLFLTEVACYSWKYLWDDTKRIEDAINMLISTNEQSWKTQLIYASLIAICFAIKSFAKK